MNKGADIGSIRDKITELRTCINLLGENKSTSFDSPHGKPQKPLHLSMTFLRASRIVVNGYENLWY